ncbi:MAG: hypothetical protein ACYDH5_13345 [Acidimicrobiales bacterium]
MTSIHPVGGGDRASGTGATRRTGALRALGEKLWSYSATRGGLVFVVAASCYAYPGSQRIVERVERAVVAPALEVPVDGPPWGVS